MKDYELIEPTVEVIKQFNRIWNGKDDIYDVELFKNSGKENIADYKCIKDNNYATRDKQIEKIFECLSEDSEEEAYDKAVIEIDRVYNTMIKNHQQTANNIFNERKTLFELIENEQYINAVNLLACVDKPGGSYLYSFATKFCSFLVRTSGKENDGGPPIFDSIASNLIREFLKDEKVSLSAMGEYKYYVDQYNAFKDKYSIKKINNKEIDIFLWLYGKVIREYWRKAGVLSFSSVYYKKP